MRSPRDRPWVLSGQLAEIAASREGKTSKKSRKPVTEKMRSTASEGAARRIETPRLWRASLERTRAERAVESIKATPLMSTTTAPTPLLSEARSMAPWTLGRAVQVHLAADGDDGVGVGVLVYADLEVRADPLLS
jgi:hypothetical protein